MLGEIGLAYEYMGGVLGGRPADRSCYDAGGRVLYERVAENDLFDDGIRRIMRAADERRVAPFRTEKEPLECHRILPVARALDARNVKATHIFADDGSEDHGTTLDRLRQIHKLPSNGDMFRSRADVILEALARQGQKFTYVAEQSPSFIDDHEGIL